MNKVTRDEIIDYVTYGEQRDAIRQDVLRQKKPRRIHVGSEVTLLFENHDTVRYQVQEMIRAEQIVKEVDIRHEIETYNELLGDAGELGCTMLIEIDDAAARPARLKALLTLPSHIFAELEDGTRVQATFDPRQVGDDRVSSVQFLKFDVGGKTPAALVIDHEAMQARAELDPAQRDALATDLVA